MGRHHQLRWPKTKTKWKGSACIDEDRV
jgi:hypothetical protein